MKRWHYTVQIWEQDGSPGSGEKIVFNSDFNNPVPSVLEAICNIMIALNNYVSGGSHENRSEDSIDLGDPLPQKPEP